MSSKSREWLLYNAVLTWLHHYDLSEYTSEFTDDYKLLAEELRQVYEQSTTTKTQKPDVQRKDKGRRNPQAIRQARKRMKQLIKKLK